MVDIDEVREALVQASYHQLAAEKSLTVAIVAPGRALVPDFWRTEAEERIEHLLDALTTLSRIDDSVLTVSWCGHFH